MLRLYFYIFIIAIVATQSSCQNIKRKMNKVVGKTQQKMGETQEIIIDKKNQIVNKAFPIYDSDKPDTKNNKNRFKEHLQVELTNDVRNIYAYGDFLGTDYKVLISFNCDLVTLNNIVRANAMKLTMDDYDEGLLFLEDFFWWNKKTISKIRPFKVGKESEYWQYLWFDQKTQTVFYEEFSL